MRPLIHKTSALLLSCLLVSMWGYIPMVFADSYSVNVVDASGEDNIFEESGTTKTGWMQRPDTINIEVRVQTPSGNVDTDQVELVQGGSSMDFESCSGNTCSITRPDVYFTSEKTYDVKLYDNESTHRTSAGFFLVPDYQPPRINQFEVSPSTSNDGSFTITYDVEDIAYGSREGIGLGDDSGGNGIKIYEDGSQTDSIPTSWDKSKSGTYTYQASAGNDGSFSLCIKASDRFGQSAPDECQSVAIDSTPPSALNVTFMKGDEEISHLSNKTTSGSIWLTLSGHGVNDSAVNASCPSITAQNPGTADSCDSEGTNTVCEWNNVKFLIESSKSSPSCDFGFADIYGNTGTASLSGSPLKLDADPPEPQELRVNEHAETSQDILFQENNITLTINERDLGGHRPTLDLSNVGLGSAVPPDNCEQNGNQYTCKWTSLGSGIYEEDTELRRGIYVNSFSDAVGNTYSGNFGTNVTLDTQGPDLINASLIFTEAASRDMNYSAGGTQRPVKGDNIQLRVFAEDDDDPVTAKANFSKFNPNTTGLVSAGCTEINNGTFNCTWDEITIKSERFGNLPAFYTLEDDAGNTYEGKEKIFVYGLLNESMDLWTHTDTACSPNPIDREMSQKVAQEMFCSSLLEPAGEEGTSVKVIETRAATDGCEAADNYSENYVKDSGFLSNLLGPNKTNPIMRLKLRQKKMDIDNINYNCTVKILSEVEQNGNLYVTETYEKEIIPLQVEFYNQPLGNYDDGLVEDIKEDVDDLKKYADLINTLRSITKTLKKICNVVSFIRTVVSGIATIQALLSGTPPTKAAAQGVKAVTYKGSSLADSAVYNYATEFCQWFSCKKSLWSTLSGPGSHFEDSELLNNVDDFTSGPNDLQVGAGDSESGTAGLNLSAYPSVKDSLLMSIATVCLPGIVKNLKELAAIKCYHGSCLINSMRLNVKQDTCESQESYLTCEFVMGEVFGIIPWVGAIQKILGQIMGLLSNPFKLVFAAVGALCHPLVAGSAEPHAACEIVKGAGMVMQFVSWIKNFTEKGWDMVIGNTDDYYQCDEFNTQLEQLDIEGFQDEDAGEAYF